MDLWTDRFQRVTNMGSMGGLQYVDIGTKEERSSSGGIGRGVVVIVIRSAAIGTLSGLGCTNGLLDMLIRSLASKHP